MARSFILSRVHSSLSADIPTTREKDWSKTHTPRPLRCHRRTKNQRFEVEFELIVQVDFEGHAPCREGPHSKGVEFPRNCCCYTEYAQKVSGFGRAFGIITICRLPDHPDWCFLQDSDRRGHGMYPDIVLLILIIVVMSYNNAASSMLMRGYHNNRGKHL